MANTLTIICSNKPRNGKTLLARMIADRLSLAGTDTFRIYDTDFPDGELAAYFPESSEVIDLSRTPGQVKLFDTIIAEPGYDYIIDLQSSLLDTFFRIYGDIAFDVAAHDEGLSVTVYFVLDRTLATVEAAAKVAKSLRESEFVIVRNEAMGNVLTLPEAAKLRDEIVGARDLVLPRLSVDALNWIDQPEFTFAGFIARNGEGTPLELRIELWNFLEAVYNQRSHDGEGAVLL